MACRRSAARGSCHFGTPHGKYRPVPVLRELTLRPGTSLDQEVKDMIAREPWRTSYPRSDFNM
jgi:hypothetical protein